MGKLSYWKTFKRTLKSQTKEFFKNSTIHGIHYIAEENLHSLERLAWLLICCLGMVSTAVIIVLLWEKFQTNPTITGLDTDFHDWNVEFPAITLCVSHPHRNEYVASFISKWNMSNLNVSNNGMSEECAVPKDEDDDHVALSADGKSNCLSRFLIDLAGLNYENLDAFKSRFYDDNLPQDGLRNLTFEVVAHCEDLFKDCKWKGKTMGSCCVPDHRLGLRPIFTDHGFCYSFNSHKAELSWPWLNKEIESNKVLEIYETDESWDFSFNLKDIKHFPVKVFIHEWEEVPATDNYPQHEWDGRVGSVAFSPKTTYTTPETRQLSVRQRHCIFPDEIQLTLDPEIYTHSVCMRECHAEEAMKLCGCVPPLINEIGKYKHCNLTGMGCLAENKAKLRTGKSCNCELSCMHTVYEVEKLGDGSGNGNQNKPLDIGFVSWPMVRYKREVLFGWVDLLVSFGGIAGLFLGCSLLSGVEIIYYFILRTLYLTLMKLKNKHDIQINNSKKSIKMKNLYLNDDSIIKDFTKLKTMEKQNSFRSRYWDRMDIKKTKNQKRKGYERKLPTEFTIEYLP